MTTARPTSSPLVSIVIPVFNKCNLTAQCLKAIAAVTSHIPHEIIVVDNASTDGTQDFMRQQRAPVRYIRNDVNRNFAGACNQGAAAAAGKFLLFLNNDTVPLQGWLEPLIGELQANPKVVAVGAKLLYESGLVQHAGVVFSREMRSPMHPYRQLRADDPRVNRRRELQAVTAACVLMRPESFQAAGRFCEEFRNGYEDLDLCLNLRRQGGIIVYQPKSVVFHLESQTPGRMKHDNENRALFFQKWIHAVLSDEDAFYFADGYYRKEAPDGRPEMPKLIRLADEAEQSQWRQVAQSQLLAAEWRRGELMQILTEADAWPQEAAVRLWAGCLCQRLGAKEAAQKHFLAAYALEDGDQAGLLISGTDVSGSSRTGTMAMESGLRALRAGETNKAVEAFEVALLQGASPNLALAGLWQTGQSPAVRHALHNLARLNPEAVRDFPGKIENEQQPESKLVSIIILVLNQLEHTRACLISIAAHTPQPHEVIIVDNGSTDGTPEFLWEWCQSHSNCVVIRNESNRGFAAGNNQGLAIARGDEVVLLNNDTVVTEGWLTAMSLVLAKNPEAGITGPMSNRVSGPQWVKEADYQNLEALPAFAAKWSSEYAGESFPVSRAVGFCLMARRQVIDRIGGLEEKFGLGNFEDDDFCIRALLAGFKIRIAKDSFVHHTGSQTFKGAKVDYRQMMLRNWEIFRVKWQLGPEASLEKGYRMPVSLPSGAALNISLPNLAETHGKESGAFWHERVRKPHVSLAKSVPSAATLGRLDDAREFFKRSNWPAAWSACRQAIVPRSFHPEAYLLLAEIALAVGDASAARTCAQFAESLAPGWPAPHQFLARSLKGNAKPDWLQLPEAAQAVNSRRPSLSICLIVKNEERFLAQCLKSIQAVATQIVVVDTGSTDRTVEIAREFDAEVHSFQWCDDFAAARNAALEHATGDWILMLDADEELPLAQHKNLLADLGQNEALAVRLPLINQGLEAEGRNFVPRLFRNAPGIFFIGRIHEQFFPSIAANAKIWGLTSVLGTAELLHHGYTKELVRDRNKVARNLKLLQEAVREFPTDANLMMNFGLELVRSGDLSAGVAKYREAFELMSAQNAEEVVPELREVLLAQFVCQLYKLSKHDEVVRVLNSPLAQRGGLTASLHFAMGLALFELKKFAEAAEQMRQCIIKRKLPSLSPVNQDVFTAAPNHCLALCLAKTGDEAGAEKAFQAAMNEPGQGMDVRLDYAKFLAGRNQQIEALKLLHAMVSTSSGNAAVWRLGGEIALSKPEFLGFARDWTGEAIRHAGDNAIIAAQRGEALMLSGDLAGAMEFWERAWNVAPEPAWLAALILCQLAASPSTHAPRNEPEEALVSREFITWYRKLLAMRAQPVIVQMNDHTEKLARALPGAAKILEATLAEMRRCA